SGFTAVNRHPTQLLTPRSSATTRSQQTQPRLRATGNRRLRHNPAVAQYLGLGSSNEPTHLVKYAPLPVVLESPPPSPARKRRRLADGESTLGYTRKNANDNHGSNQRRVSESFRVTKTTRKSALVMAKTPASESSRPLFAYATGTQTSLTDGNLDAISKQGQPVQIAQSTILKNDNSKSARSIHHDTHQIDGSIIDDDDFDNDINDDDLLLLTSELHDKVSDKVDEISYASAESSTVFDDTEQHLSQGSTTDTAIMSKPNTSIYNSQPLSRKYVSPVTLTTRLLAATGNMGVIKIRKPIVRPSFPDSVRDRSPIIGLTSCTLLKTCFRIGEAINQSCQASRSGKRITVELYARVLDSERTDTKQHFTFCDLFHPKPPHIKAVYEAAIWESVPLYEYDSRRLLQEGRICRCIGTMRRDGKAWVMTVLNIWEATWDDIEWVEGIVNF
ncbi:uncharacterized protein K460DRAFT_272517, partial [Cucurbitaria berberidis CBS 394.84]